MFLMILYSFVGGLILNLMPCVFPVLALKAFGFIRTAGEDKSARLMHVGAYTVGIVGTMVAFAGLIAVIRYSGGVVGWGFQFSIHLSLSLCARFYFSLRSTCLVSLRSACPVYKQVFKRSNRWEAAF